MDQHRHLTLGHAVRLSRGLVEDAVDPLDLDEVVAGAHRPELAGSALPRTLGDRRRVGAGERATRLAVLDVVLASVHARALDEDRIEIGPAARTAVVLPGSGGHHSGNLVDEGLAPSAQLLGRERGGE